MKKKKILVVDDDESVAGTIKLLLETANCYEVKVLLQAKDILSHVHVFKPDVILLDLLMPDIGGLEVCEMLDKDSIGMGTPIIVVSGLDKDVDKVSAYKLGIVDYLVKPITRDSLIASIEKAIKSKEQKD
jgi:two-component system alkaline phosphatase synthesis response regulator PhoP